MFFPRGAIALCSLLLTVSIARPAESSEAASAVRKGASLLFLSDSQARAIKGAFSENDPDAAEFKRHLRRLAGAQMTRGPWSVTYSPSKAVSGDPHDYYSEGPYWWPDPKNPGGPYIRRDGEVNPKHFSAHRHALDALGEAVLTLGMAAYFFDEERYANRVAHLVRVWFIDEKTRMNPHLEYGQAIHGRTTGRGIGLIDTTSLIDVVQGLAFLEQSRTWNAADREAVRKWFADFLHWMTHSRKGLDEKKHGNNHSTWWAAQVAAYAIYLDDKPAQAMVWNLYRDFLVPHQMRPDGSCPLEEARTKSLSYSVMNLEGFGRICRLAQIQGVDLWRFRLANGAGIETSIAYLTPFIEDPKSWKKKQIRPVHSERRSLFAFAGIGLQKPEYLEIYRRLPPREGAFALLVDMLVNCGASGTRDNHAFSHDKAEILQEPRNANGND